MKLHNLLMHFWIIYLNQPGCEYQDRYIVLIARSRPRGISSVCRCLAQLLAASGFNATTCLFAIVSQIVGAIRAVYAGGCVKKLVKLI